MRNLALLRLLACGLEDPQSQERSIFILDTNVPRFFADPVSDSHLVQIFGGRPVLGLPGTARLASVEDRLLNAFARGESDRLKDIFSGLRTHVFRPHLLEISWWRAQAQETVRTRMSGSDEDLEKEATYISNLERQLSQPRILEDRSEAGGVFNIFLQSFHPSIVRHVQAMVRLNECVRVGLFSDPDTLDWERGNRADPSLWNFFHSSLTQLRATQRSTGEINFRVMQDAEVLSLLCAYANQTNSFINFVTFDWAIILLFFRIYNDPDFFIEDGMKEKLPKENFVRHPIIYTSFCSKFSEGLFEIRGFIRHIDLLFSRKGRSRVYRRNLANISLLKPREELAYLFNSGDQDIEKNIRQVARVVEDNLMFVHEESAVGAVESFLSLKLSEQALSLETERHQSIIQIVKEQIESRSEEKIAALIKAFALVPLLPDYDAEHDGTADEANIIIHELSMTSTGRYKQLRRNLPGWIRVDEEMKEILQSIIDGSEAFINTLFGLPPDLNHRFYLLGALIAAMKDNWLLSERYSLIAKDLSTDDPRSLAEAEYWLAVSRRHVIDPGLWRLASASRRLRRAVSLIEQLHPDTTKIDLMRFRSEQEALHISFFCHGYVYGDHYIEEKALLKSPRAIFESLTRLVGEFRVNFILPLGAIEFRLALQLYTNLCAMYLFSWGLPPGTLWTEAPLSKRAARSYFEDLRRLCSNRNVTVSIPTSFVVFAGEIVLERKVENFHKLQILTGSSEDVLLAFDRKLIFDGLEWLRSKFSPSCQVN